MYNKTLNYQISDAKLEDIKDLIQICRLTFPESIRWKSPNLWATIWWQHIITSGIACTFIIRMDNDITAFVVLIKNEIIFNNYMRNNPIKFYNKLYSALLCPHLLVKHIMKKIKQKFSIKDSNIVINPYQTSPDTRTWIEIIGTNPDFQGQGFARQLLRYCENETIKLNKKSIALRVDLDNYKAQQFYEKSGYRRVELTNNCFNYYKTLLVDSF